MKKNIIAAAIVIGAIAWSASLVAQPGIGISKEAPIVGTGSSGDKLRLQACASGSGYVHNGTSFACTPVQQRVTGTCAGSAMTAIASDGSVTCGPAGSTYTAGTSLTESPTGTFNVNIPGTGSPCVAGTAVDNITSDGTASCGATVGTGDIEGVTTSGILTGGCTSGTCSLDTSITGPTILGRTSGTGATSQLTGTQATTLLDTFSTSGTTKGLVSGSSSASTACLKGNNTWGPCGGSRATATWSGTVNNYSVVSTTDVIEVNLTGDATLTGIDSCGALGDTVDIVYTHATSSGYTLTLANLSSSSTLGNRFFYDDGNVVLERGSGVHLRCANVAGSDVTNGNYWIVTIPPASGGAADGLGADGDKGDFTVSGGAGNVATIDNDAINAAKIAADAVGTSEIATDGVGSAEIAADAVGASEIAAGAVGTSELADNLDLSGNGPTTLGQLLLTEQEVSTTGTIDDLALNDTTTHLIFTGGSSIILTGMTGGADNRCILVTASTTSGAGVAITHEGSGSTAANRSVTAGNGSWTLISNATVMACYEGADSRWHWVFNTRFPSIVVSGSASVGSLAVTGTSTLTGNITSGDAWSDDFDITSETMYQGDAPTLSGCDSACTIASYSTNHRGRITCTDDSGSDCTVTFANSGWETNAPACTLTFEKSTAPSAAPYVKSVSTTAFTFDQFTTGAHAYSYHCDGMI